MFHGRVPRLALTPLSRSSNKSMMATMPRQPLLRTQIQSSQANSVDRLTINRIRLGTIAQSRQALNATDQSQRGLATISQSRQGSNKSTVSAVLKELFLTYLEVSSIHGLFHLQARQRTPGEYFFWVLCLCLGVLGAFYIGDSTWSRYRDNPTVISMERNYQEFNTTFPSLSLCLQTTLSEERLAKLVKQYPDKKTRDATRRLIEAVSSARYDNLDKLDYAALENSTIPPEQYLHYIQQTIFPFYYESVTSNGKNISMTTTWGEQGPCYTYNSVVAIYNNFNYWQEKNWNVKIDLDKLDYGNPLDGDVYSSVTNMTTDTWVMFHGYNEVPEITSRRHPLKNVHDYFEFEMAAWIIYSSAATRHLSIEQRKCRFLDESNLPTSPVYTYNTCRMQCRSALARRLCDCVPHFYRHTVTGVRPAVCDAKGLQCIQKYSDQLIKLLDSDTDEKTDCGCLPACDDIAFTIERIESVPWHSQTTIKFGIQEYPRMRLKRDILFGFYDLLVSIGGTAGLFLGCSVLSFIEILYYCTLRLFWMCRSVHRSPQ